MSYKIMKAETGLDTYLRDWDRGIINKGMLGWSIGNYKCLHKIHLRYVEKHRPVKSEAMQFGIDVHAFDELFWTWIRGHMNKLMVWEKNYNKIYRFFTRSTIHRNFYSRLKSAIYTFLDFEARRLIKLQHRHPDRWMDCWVPISSEIRATNWELGISTKVDRVQLFSNREAAIYELKTGKAMSETDMRRELAFGKLIMEDCEPGFRIDYPITTGLLYNPILEAEEAGTGSFCEPLKKRTITALKKAIVALQGNIRDEHLPASPGLYKCFSCQFRQWCKQRFSPKN